MVFNVIKISLKFICSSGRFSKLNFLVDSASKLSQQVKLSLPEEQMNFKLSNIPGNSVYISNKNCYKHNGKNHLIIELRKYDN